LSSEIVPEINIITKNKLDNNCVNKTNLHLNIVDELEREVELNSDTNNMDRYNLRSGVAATAVTLSNLEL